jgi:tetratricopeptide (TPR) repeat protein
MENLQQVTPQQEVDEALVSLIKNPDNPSLYKPLLGRLLQRQAFSEAARLLSFVVEHNPTDLNALINLGLALEFSGRLEEAKIPLLKARDANPTSPEIYLQLSQVFQKLGEIDEAVLAAQEALKYKPDFEMALLKLGELYLNSAGALEKAEKAVQRLLQCNPNHASAYGLLGVIYLKSKKYAQAEEAVLKLLKQSPNNGGGYANLSLIQGQIGKLDEAEANARKAIILSPQFHKAYSQLGHVLYLKGQFLEAEAAFSQSVKLVPNDLQTHVAAAAAIAGRGDITTASAILKNILVQTKKIDFYHQLIYAVWPILKNPAFINLACDIALDWRQGASEALAIKSVVLNDLGQDLILPKLTDYSTLVKTHKVSVPEGFKNLETFNEALTETIRNAAELKFEPTGKAIIAGYRLQNMGEQMNDATRALYKIFRNAVEEHMQDLSASTAFSFLQKKPASYSIYAWGNIHKGQGYEFPHYHADGWISGVYYPKLPAVLEQKNSKKQAWIEFGTPREDLPFTNTKWKTRGVKPETGLVVLFPSYIWHRTLPYSSSDERVSIAFDAIPAR